MFGSLGLPELLMIFVVALLLFGPRKLPEIGRTLGKAMNEFKRATNDLQRSLEEEIAVDELKQTKREVEEATRLTPPAVQAPAAQPAAAQPPATAVTPEVGPETTKPEPMEPR
ncbi:MAG: twin arginine-targeting protein translocase TatB [Acidobacteria bacterium 21-70-11]|nr:MAG: twin arginine-targeting protein translocase TatB [Acidobacteria bacterium 21-70-11]OYW03188.1 MAG: twin arginine-targeting protein translocase TatB [Acidobacteria bacterium 37-71-11]HQT95570.1 Sec-independent protein translocase protein TatB [Thermoanaerobaculaceae bacterium]HQU33481.1 Sec-independent protein translocase protein TatB [Thermoanaerobaculaceae bacterium]